MEKAALSLEAAQAKELQDCQQEASRAEHRAEQLVEENESLTNQMQNLDRDLQEKLENALQV